MQYHIGPLTDSIKDALKFFPEYQLEAAPAPDGEFAVVRLRYRGNMVDLVHIEDSAKLVIKWLKEMLLDSGFITVSAALTNTGIDLTISLSDFRRRASQNWSVNPSV